MSQCVSRRSQLCAGIGNKIWQGMCSNCADEQDRTKKMTQSNSVQQARREDYEERMEFFREHSDSSSGAEYGGSD